MSKITEIDAMKPIDRKSIVDKLAPIRQPENLIFKDKTIEIQKEIKPHVKCKKYRFYNIINFVVSQLAGTLTAQLTMSFIIVDEREREKVQAAISDALKKVYKIRGEAIINVYESDLKIKPNKKKRMKSIPIKTKCENEFSKGGKLKNDSNYEMLQPSETIWIKKDDDGNFMDIEVLK